MVAAVGGALSGARLRWQEPAVTFAAASILCIAILPPFAHISRELLSSTDALALLGEGRLWWLLARSLALSLAVTLLAWRVRSPRSLQATPWAGRRSS